MAQRPQLSRRRKIGKWKGSSLLEIKLIRYRITKGKLKCKIIMWVLQGWLRYRLWLLSTPIKCKENWQQNHIEIDRVPNYNTANFLQLLNKNNGRNGCSRKTLTWVLNFSNKPTNFTDTIHMKSNLVQTSSSGFQICVQWLTLSNSLPMDNH